MNHIAIPDLIEDHYQRTGERLRMGTDEGWRRFCNEHCRAITPEEQAVMARNEAAGRAFVDRAAGKPEFDTFMARTTAAPESSMFMARATKKPRQRKGIAA